MVEAVVEIEVRKSVALPQVGQNFLVESLHILSGMLVCVRDNNAGSIRVKGQ